MKYKNILQVLPVLAVISLSTTGCKFEQEDLFDETASLRLTHQNDKIKSRLVEQSKDGKYGWVIQYHVAGTDELSFEGFNLLGRFYADKKVTLASDHRYLRDGNSGKYTEYTSTYNMLEEEGPVLSFDTWSDILTVFEDPVDPSKAPGSLIENGEGMFGDHNLIFQAMDGQTIQFCGQRHRASVRFVPCDRPWQQYLNDTKALKSKVANSTLTSYYVICKTDTMYFVGLNKGLIVYGERVYDPLIRKNLSCVFTPSGFRIEHEDTISGVTFQEFNVTPDSSALVSLDGQVRVIPCWDSYMTTHTAIWGMDPSLFSAEQQSLMSQLNTEIAKYNANWSIKSIGFGKSTGGGAVNGLVVTFYVDTAKSKTNTVGMVMAQKRVAYGQIELDVADSPKVDNNMTAIAKKAANLTSLVQQFANTLKGRYSVTPNDFFLPTGGTYTPVAGGTSFAMSAAQ